MSIIKQQYDYNDRFRLKSSSGYMLFQNDKIIDEKVDDHKLVFKDITIIQLGKSTRKKFFDLIELFFFFLVCLHVFT